MNCVLYVHIFIFYFILGQECQSKRKNQPREFEKPRNLRWLPMQHHYFWYYVVNSDCNDPKWHPWTSHCIWPANSPLVFYLRCSVWWALVGRALFWPMASTFGFGHAICRLRKLPEAKTAFLSNLQNIQSEKISTFDGERSAMEMFPITLKMINFIWIMRSCNIRIIQNKLNTFRNKTKLWKSEQILSTAIHWHALSNTITKLRNNKKKKQQNWNW